MKHLWIIEKKSGKYVFYYNFTDKKMDGILTSGLLSALNQFSEIEVKDQGIDSIDMNELRWVYHSDSKSNLLLVAADDKTANSKLMHARLEVIKKMFVETYQISTDFWDMLPMELSQFDGFGEIVTTLQKQWIEADKMMNVGDTFDLLGIFQQIFIKLIKIINDNFKGKNHIEILQKINEFTPRLEKWHKDQQIKDSYRIIELFIPKVDLNNDTIHFDKDPGTILLGLNPIGLDQTALKPVFFIVFAQMKREIALELGEALWLETFNHELRPYLFLKWDALNEKRILKELFEIFLN